MAEVVKKRDYSKASAAAPLGYLSFMGWIGALVYFMSLADGFWEGIIAVLQSIVWPAYVIYYVMVSLGVQ